MSASRSVRPACAPQEASATQEAAGESPGQGLEAQSSISQFQSSRVSSHTSAAHGTLFNRPLLWGRQGLNGIKALPSHRISRAPNRDHDQQDGDRGHLPCSPGAPGRGLVHPPVAGELGREGWDVGVGPGTIGCCVPRRSDERVLKRSGVIRGANK